MNDNNEDKITELVEHVEVMLVVNIILIAFRQMSVRPNKETRMALRILDRWMEHMTSLEELTKFGNPENITVELKAIRALMNDE